MARCVAGGVEICEAGGGVEVEGGGGSAEDWEEEGEGEEEEEKEKNGHGVHMFFEKVFFPRLALVVVVRGGRYVMRVARRAKVFEGMEGKDGKDGKNKRPPTAGKKGYREEGIEQRLNGTAARVLCG